MNARFTVLFMFVALSMSAQTNLVRETNGTDKMLPAAPSFSPSQTNQIEPVAEHIQRVRAACIQGRRSLCGKILRVLPEGLVIESGYTNLLREPIDKSWLVPGTVTAIRAPGLIESQEPGSVCVGLVFLADIPKSRRAKPKPYDYVIIEGYPAGHYNYTSVGDIHRTVRRFSASLKAAVDYHLQLETDQTPVSPDAVK
jgi:hypothetical protein